MATTFSVVSFLVSDTVAKNKALTNATINIMWIQILLELGHLQQLFFYDLIPYCISNFKLYYINNDVYNAKLFCTTIYTICRIQS
jgi:hypothetical protein